MTASSTTPATELPHTPTPHAATASRNIWQFQNTVSRRLLSWATANIAAGLWLQRRNSDLLSGIGSQSVAWGTINALIAIGGRTASAVRYNGKTDPHAPGITEKEHKNLFRALWINAILDIFYMAGGMALARTRGRSNEQVRGIGWGIVIQGAFLFLFDLIHAARMAGDKQS